VDNDGLHAVTERSGSVYLKAGLHPIRVEWFNGLSSFALEVEFQGPGAQRQRIPDSALYRMEAERAGGGSNLVHGVNYRCYEGNWARLPDFSRLNAVKMGAAANFELGVRTRDPEVAIQFAGYVRVPLDGVYTFWTSSDDGSRLYIDETKLQLAVTGSAALPAPRRISPGQALGEEDDCQWTEVEGTAVSLHSRPSGTLEIELSSGAKRMYVDVEDASGHVPTPFSRIRARGICRSLAGANGQLVAGGLVVPSLKEIEVLAAGAGSRNLNVSDLARLRREAAARQRLVLPVRLQGLVLATSHDGQLFTLQDDSGVAMVEMDTRDQSIQAGQEIALEGTCAVEGGRLILQNAAPVDNDGTHHMIEKSGAIFLRTGKHPLHLSWFNRYNPSGLEVYYQGPGLPRQKIPDSALFRGEFDETSGTVRWVPGLSYRCSEGYWRRTSAATPFETVSLGATKNFDIAVASREENVGLEFNGSLEVARDGIYTFATVSDDGSVLFVDHRPPRLEVTGTNSLPAPVPVAAHQILREDQRDRWSQVEGTISFAGEVDGTLELELSSGTGRMRIEVADSSGSSPALLANSRVRAVGICQSTYTADGRQVAGVLVVPSMQQIEMLEINAAHWPRYPVLSASLLAGANFKERIETIVHVRGIVSVPEPGGPLMLADKTGRVLLETTQAPPRAQGIEIEALGRWSREGSNVVLRCAGYRELMHKANGTTETLPLLTSIEQVKGLTREEAIRGYPVKIRGLITSPFEGGFFIQDATWAVYVSCDSEASPATQRAGDYWEIEGETYAEFAPNIRARHAERLGEGTLPEPLRPAWDQLINGSLDTVYVEVQGIVTAAESDGISLLTRAGKIKVLPWGAELAELKPYENALIRVRGCVIPERDVNTQQVHLGRIQVSNYSIQVDEPAPADPFAAILKRVPDLLQFDPRAGALERVKIAGQVVHRRGSEYFLMEGTNGLRFVPRAQAQLGAGDRVEVVGFPDLGGPSPVLREAVVRRLGQAALPSAQALLEENLLSRQHDATLVRVEGRLVNTHRNRTEDVLEMQTGRRGFVARRETRNGPPHSLLPGSLLALTGVYVGQGGDVASGRDVDSFELLLNASSDIKVLERPPWWSVRHLLTVVGGMAFVILVGLVWITLLRRQVEERSAQLALEIQRREHTERQRALEEERSRIAQDLHDDLGATLTQIRLLSALESRDALLPENTRTRMEQVTEKSHEMVASLDEIVWAVNPANDSLPNLATYLCQFAEEFLRPSPIRCRLDVDDHLPPLALTSEVRHNIYLAVREALNNIAKHSHATEAWLRIQWREQMLHIALEDNGQGLGNLNGAPTGNGMGNMRHRLEKIGGRFQYDTQPAGAGTICKIWLPLESPARMSNR
jgi:signal transduction histidine kinase